MLRSKKLKKATISGFACACAAFALAASGSAVAQDSAKPPITGKEEVLEDGQVVTRLVPRNGARASEDHAPIDEAPAGNPPPSSSALSVLVIVAHPDDELIFAPALSRIAREGGEVTLVFATSGDQGPGLSGLEPGDELATMREDEARCAAFALGLEEPIYWRFGDGTLANEARNEQKAMRDIGERIAGLITLHKPNAIMTWGPDGGYGHADHRITSSAVTQVVQAMGPERPDLLYAAFPASEQDEGKEDALPGFEGWARTHPSLITDQISYEPFDLDAAMASANCYESQFDAEARKMFAGTLHQRVWRGKVSLRLAFIKPR